MSPIRTLSLLLIALLLLPTPPAAARELGGIPVEERVASPDGTGSLVLNGAGFRSKFFMKIYLAALYLPERTGDAETAIRQPGPKRVLMHFVYRKVDADKIREGWTEGFRANLTPGEFEVLEPSLAAFNALFPDLRKGDRVWIDYIPGKGTEVRINDQLRGKIPGADFYRALLRVWLGRKPADEDLRQALLGQS